MKMAKAKDLTCTLGLTDAYCEGKPEAYYNPDTGVVDNTLGVYLCGICK